LQERKALFEYFQVRRRRKISSGGEMIAAAALWNIKLSLSLERREALIPKEKVGGVFMIRSEREAHKTCCFQPVD